MLGGVSRNLTALRRFQDAITAVHMISPSGLWRDRTGMSHRRTSGSVSVVPPLGGGGGGWIAPPNRNTSKLCMHNWWCESL